jgi:hypothetical protein
VNRAFLLLGTVCAAALLVRGIVEAGEAKPVSERRREVRIGAVDPDAALSSGLVGLPPGIQVDPMTGLLVGVVPPDVPGCTALPWERLREYEYRPGLEGLPESLKRLDGQKVVMLGFLMAVFEYDDIREFHLVGNHWSCCFGVPPSLADTVYVRLKEGQEGLPATLRPIRVIGTLRIEEVKESGIVYAIYSIPDAEVTILDY